MELQEYTVFIPLNVTAESKEQAVQYALDDVRDPRLMSEEWMAFVAEGLLDLGMMDLAGLLQRAVAKGD